MINATANTFKSLIGILLISGMNIAAAQDLPDARLAELQNKIQQLQIRNQNLSKALVEAKQQKDKAIGELNKIRKDLEALNMFPLGTDSQRLVDAVKNRKVLETKIANLETGAVKLTTTIREYLKHAIMDDDQRKSLESSIRGLDEALGFIHKPKPQIDQGNLQAAKIIAIDSKSGVIVLNAGEKQEVRVGQTFRILRGKVQIAEARIADARPQIAGALIIRLDDSNNAVRIGDTASIKTTKNN